MRNVRFLQACEDSSEFLENELSPAYLDRCIRVIPKKFRGQVIGATCINKFRAGEERTIPDSQAQAFEDMGIVEVLS